MIECVANVSEGRDAAAISAMGAAVRSAGARLLDVHSDVDHHRSVFTFAGAPDDVERAAVCLASEAVARVDLRRHRGVHPRIGALDVVPFVPLSESTMAACVGAARRVGSAIAAEYGVPVFLYGEAATEPQRASLSALRRGGLEGLSRRIGTPGWVPDFGPAALHPTAGATAVGARPLLIAYNVCLGTEDAALGLRIAAATRGTGGGLPGVLALAFPLQSRRCVQISMNLTDIERTSVPEAYDWVQRLAADCGTAVIWTEIVGLAPRRALSGATSKQLQLRDDVESHVLEARLEGAR